MNGKSLKIVQKGIILCLILIFMIPNIASAFFKVPQYNNNSILEIVEKRYQDITKYTQFLQELNTFTNGLDTSINVEDAKIKIIEKISELQKKYNNSSAIPFVSSQILNKTISSSSANTTNLIGEMLSTIKKYLMSSNLVIESLTPDVVVNDMLATTAGKLSGEQYKVKLSGNIYYANLENGKPTSDKWVILVHGFSMNGQAMADTLGHMYLEQGFNVLAPDLRGFGNSEGSNGMGYLESLDVWDWLNYLNANQACSEVIIHGISLGGATTIFLSGLEVDGKTLKEQNVIGLVEDCGYTSITGIIQDLLDTTSNNELVAKILGILNKDSLSSIVDDTTMKKFIIENLGVGLTEENFDTLQNGLNSLQKCEVPLLIVHGTADTTVPVKNSTQIYEQAIQNDKIPYVQKFIAEGENHAFIVLGNKYNVYEGHVKNFIKQAELIKSGYTIQKESNYQSEAEKKASPMNSLIKALKLIKNMMG